MVIGCSFLQWGVGKEGGRLPSHVKPDLGGECSDPPEWQGGVTAQQLILPHTFPSRTPRGIFFPSRSTSGGDGCLRLLPQNVTAERRHSQADVLTHTIRKVGNGMSG